MQRKLSIRAQKGQAFLSVLFGAFLAMALFTALGCSSPSSSSGNVIPVEPKEVFTVTFDKGNAPESGATQTPPDKMIVAAGEKLVLPERGSLPLDAIANPGTYFIGWSDKPASADEDFSGAAARVRGTSGERLPVSSDITLYAVYVTTSATEKTQQVTNIVLYKNFGTSTTPDVDAGTWPIAYSSKIAAGQMILPDAGKKPSRPGYTFDGWTTTFNSIIKYPYLTAFLAGTEVPTPNLTTTPPITADFQVYAHWTAIGAANLVNIRYHPNGATAGTDPVESIPYGNTQAMPVLSFEQINALAATDWVYEGKTILGWATTDTGQVVYKPGTTIVSETALDLYAVWTAAFEVSLERDNATAGSIAAGQYPNAPTLNPTFASAGPFVVKVVPGESFSINSGAFEIFADVANTAGYTIQWGTRSSDDAPIWTALSDQTSYTPTADVTLYVQFTGKPVNIVFYKNDGVTPPVTDTTAPAGRWGEAVGITIPAAVKAWANANTELGYSGLANLATDTTPTATPGAPTATPPVLPRDVTAWVAQSTDTYAVTKSLFVFWASKTYTITFDGGAGSTGTQAALIGVWPEYVTLPTDHPTLSNPGGTLTISKDGCEWMSWQVGSPRADVEDADSSIGGVQWRPATWGTSTELTARWIPRWYRVVYSLNGSREGTAPPDSPLAYWGTPMTIASGAALTRDGYTYGGWATSSTSTTPISSPTWTPTGPYMGTYTLYAIWLGKTFTLIFDLNGPPGAAIETVTSVWPEPAPIPNTYPKWDGYSFFYWQPEGYEGIRSFAKSWKPATYGEGTTLTIRITAQWMAKTYSINFDSNGGDGFVRSIFGTWGTPIALPAAPSIYLDGYAFSGWSEWRGQPPVANPYTPPGLFTTSYRLFAVWTGNSYALTYDLAGGTAGGANPASGTFGTAVTLNGTAPTKTGSTFAGWLPPSTSGITNAIVVNGTFKPTTYAATYALTAQWTTP